MVKQLLVTTLPSFQVDAFFKVQSSVSVSDLLQLAICSRQLLCIYNYPFPEDKNQNATISYIPTGKLIPRQQNQPVAFKEVAWSPLVAGLQSCILAVLMSNSFLFLLRCKHNPRSYAANWKILHDLSGELASPVCSIGWSCKREAGKLSLHAVLADGSLAIFDIKEESASKRGLSFDPGDLFLQLNSHSQLTTVSGEALKIRDMETNSTATQRISFDARRSQTLITSDGVLFVRTGFSYSTLDNSTSFEMVHYDSNILDFDFENKLFIYTDRGHIYELSNHQVSRRHDLERQVYHEVDLSAVLFATVGNAVDGVRFSVYAPLSTNGYGPLTVVAFCFSPTREVPCWDRNYLGGLIKRGGWVERHAEPFALQSTIPNSCAGCGKTFESRLAQRCDLCLFPVYLSSNEE